MADKNFEYLMSDLDKIQPVDLMSEKTTMKEAVKWAKSILNSIINNGIRSISDENRQIFSDKLKKLGALNFEQLKQTPFFDSESKSVEDIMSKQDSIEFPLSAMAQLVDTDKSTFDFGFSLIFDGGKSSWAGTWINAQKEKSADEKFVDMLKDLDKIKPIDLMSDKTTIEEAVEWAKSIAHAITDNEVRRISDDNHILVSEKLKELGALNFEQLKQTPFFDSESESVGEIMSKQDSIEFPLSAMAQLIDTKNDTFNIGFEMAFTGGKYSWINEWLEAQDDIEEENE